MSDPTQPQVCLVPAQQFPALFAPEKFCQSTDIDQSILCCATHFRYDQSEISVARLSMDEALVLSVDGRQHRITERAFNDLCGILRIPLAFMYDIPSDLAATIIQRLKSLHAQALIAVSRGDVIVSLVDPQKWATGRGEARIKRKPPYLPVTNLSLLDLLDKVWSRADVDTRITLSDAGMQVELLQQEERFSVERVAGDVIRVGIVLCNNETGGTLPLAKGHTVRLVCTNGSTVKTNLGICRLSSDWRCSLQWRFNQFAKALQCLMQEMQARCDPLLMAYRRMTDEALNDAQLYNYYRQAQYLSRGIRNSQEHIDRLFGVEPDRRKEIIGRVRHRQRELRAANTAAIEPPQATDLLAWEVYNRLTAAARDEVRYHRRTGLQSIAGDLLNTFMP